MAVLAFGLLFVLDYYFDAEINIKTRDQVKRERMVNSGYLENEVLPPGGVEIPAVWGDLGKKMVEAGVIDAEKFEALYKKRGGLDAEQKAMLYGEGNGGIKMTPENANFLLNMLWALGLSNKNSVLEQGEMADEKYSGAGNFASTGGWTLTKGDSMDYYSKHNFIILTEEQQKLVESVSGGIFRPCCGNSVHFPDCNHGMAMLGLLELMASQGAGEQEMYDAALKVNSYWFPSTYLTLAKYFGARGAEWKKVSSKTVLGSLYSGARGYRQILQEIEPEKAKGGGGCGV